MPKRPQQLDPIRAAVSEWAQTLTPPLSPPADISLWRQALIDDAPKRFTIYEPLALLPAGSFTSKAWVAELARHHHHHDDEAQSVITTLWTLILQHLSQNGRGRCPPLTHLAINEGIPLHNSDAHDSSSSGGGGAELSENVMRSPSGLRILHGDFGPSSSSSSSSAAAAAAAASDGPSAQDFERAFWVATKQNGIWQTWAPRWTMFSRGNVKEKARLLGFPPAAAGATDAPCTATTTRQDGDDDDDDGGADDKGSRGGDGGEEKGVDAEEGETGGTGDDAWAVDLYAGIGYFAFCYARLGMRVLCWEINPWSVEALRRGARMNKWTVQVLPPTTTTTTTSTAVEAATAAQIIVFREDNQHASARIAEYRRAGWLRDVRHVNCGLLPTSRLVWACALDLGLTTRRRTWLHLHENAGEGDIGARRSEIELLLRERAGARARAANGGGRQLVGIRVEHVEKVKTYAPGVWHCVFDVLVEAAPAAPAAPSVEAVLSSSSSSPPPILS